MVQVLLCPVVSLFAKHYFARKFHAFLPASRQVITRNSNRDQERERVMLPGESGWCLRVTTSKIPPPPENENISEKIAPYHIASYRIASNITSRHTPSPSGLLARAGRRPPAGPAARRHGGAPVRGPRLPRAGAVPEGAGRAVAAGGGEGPGRSKAVRGGAEGAGGAAGAGGGAPGGREEVCMKHLRDASWFAYLHFSARR